MTTQRIQSIHENLQFLCLEVDAQLSSLADYFQSPTSERARKIVDRRGYARNLKMRIHGSALRMAAETTSPHTDLLYLRFTETVASDLDLLTSHCRSLLVSAEEVDSIKLIRLEDYLPLLEQVREALKLVVPAMEKRDTEIALTLAETHQFLDGKCHRIRKKLVDTLDQCSARDDIVQGLLLNETFRKMGDVLSHISEAAISANLGQPVNIERYLTMQAVIEGLDEGPDALKMRPVAETRSGSAISGVTKAAESDDQLVAIFKDGIKKKVKEEKQGVASWHQIYPGLAPKILSYKKSGQSAALLIEHLPGFTFEQVLLNESVDRLKETVEQIGNTLHSVWQKTMSDSHVAAKFMLQIEKRQDEVYRIHPEFRRSGVRICGVKVTDFDDLVKEAKTLEASLPAPFSVYIHGDFNIDNVIYDPIEKRINFIDLHRSRYMDYVQDVSVFMVSNYRLQVMDSETRSRIRWVIQTFYQIAENYAEANRDKTFNVRLALGLSRSFVTSSRFILDKSFARRLFLKGRYLIERVLSTPDTKLAQFKLPIKELFCD